MRLAILTVFCSLLTFVLAANPQDKEDIEDPTAILSPDVTYDPGNGPVQGLPAAIAALSKVIPPETTTYNILDTQLIKLLPLLDKYKRSNRAESISCTTLVSFGSGNLTGEFFIHFTKFVDKEIVRTREPGFGGWRFKNRKFEVVGMPIGNGDVLGPSSD